MIAAATPQGRAEAVRSVGEYPQLAVAGVGITQQGDEDAPLVRRSKRGDVNAYRQLVERHERRVASILSRIMSARHLYNDVHALDDVDDLVQEIFVLAWRALPSFRGESRFSTWLYRIATNRAIKEWRRSQKHPGRGWTDGEVDGLRGTTHCAIESGVPERDPEALFQLNARDEQIRFAIDALPEKQRVVILLHYFESYSCEDIAEVLGCSVGTVWSRLHYGCRRLRAKLKSAVTG